MKLGKNSTKNTSALWAAIITLFGVIAGLAVWLLTDRQEVINDPDDIPKDAWQAPKSSKVEEVKLPNAKPIAKMPVDFKKDGHIWRLVNKSHPFDDPNYRPNDLKLATVDSRVDKSTDERSVRQIIMPEAEKLFAAAKQAGHDLQVGSGFRSHDLQKCIMIIIREIMARRRLIGLALNLDIANIRQVWLWI